MCMRNESFVIRILVSGYWFQIFMIWRNEIKRKRKKKLLNFWVIIYISKYMNNRIISFIVCVTFFFFLFIWWYIVRNFEATIFLYLLWNNLVREIVVNIWIRDFQWEWKSIRLLDLKNEDGLKSYMGKEIIAWILLHTVQFL